MESKSVENTLDGKIKTIIAELRKNNFSLKEDTLSETEWAIKEATLTGFIKSYRTLQLPSLGQYLL